MNKNENEDEKNRDAVEAAPHLHKTIFENDKIRLIKVEVAPGEKAEMHYHPENINYVLSPGKLKFTKPDGTIKEVDIVSGQVTHAEAGSHTVENVGETTVETIQIELKNKYE